MVIGFFVADTINSTAVGDAVEHFHVCPAAEHGSSSIHVQSILIDYVFVYELQMNTW